MGMVWVLEFLKDNNNLLDKFYLPESDCKHQHRSSNQLSTDFEDCMFHSRSNIQLGMQHISFNLQDQFKWDLYMFHLDMKWGLKCLLDNICRSDKSLAKSFQQHRCNSTLVDK